MPKQLDVALIIGVDHYAHPDLPSCGAIRNADAIERWFYDSCESVGTRPNIISIRSGRGLGAKMDMIIQAIDDLCDNCPGPGSRLLFYFSGHGAIDENRADLLLCEDTGRHGPALLLDDVMRYFTHFSFDKQLFVVDSCRKLEEKLGGYSVFTGRRDKLPKVAHRPQVMKLQSTLSTYEAYADSERVQKNDPQVPCAYFTSGLVEIARGQRPEHYRWIAEMDALAIRASGLQDAMQESLRLIGQQPNIRTEGGEIELWHAPIFFERRAKSDGALPSREPLFLQDGREPLCYRRFVRAALTKLGGLDELQRAVANVAKSPNKFQAFCLAPIDSAAAGWLIRNMLFGDGQPSVDFRTIDLTASGSVSGIEAFWEILEETFGIKDPEVLVQRLTQSTVLYIVMEDLNQEEMTLAILTEFWKPLTERCQGRSLAFYLFLVSGNDRSKPIPGHVRDVWPYTPLVPVSKETVESWIERFRHELPLPIVKDRCKLAAAIAQERRTLPQIIELICVKLDIDPQWIN